ncbi:unnamed protein product [Closterium sp. NIES-54]
MKRAVAAGADVYAVDIAVVEEAEQPSDFQKLLAAIQPELQELALNKVTVKSRYPIPRTNELIDQLRTARVFSKINLWGDYHQIRVEPSDCTKIAFRTRYGSFEYTVMPFGLTNAPATFQMTMNEAFRPLLDKCVIVYLDDILVYGRDKQQHLADVDAAFKILNDQGFQVRVFFRTC